MVLGKIFGGDTIKTVGNVIDDLHFSGEEKEKLKLQMKEIDAKLREKQMSINLADAQSTAGGLSGCMPRAWRPLIGMSCALALLFEYVIKPFLLFFLATFHIETLPLPELDMGMLMPLVMSLLGMGALRTYEKQKGLTK